MEKTEDDIVAPGDKLGASEEWLPGKGTYEEDGFVYSSIFGKVEYDEEDLVANVIAVNPVSEVEKGDIVYGKIKNNRGSIASMSINLVEGEPRGISTNLEGSLHVSKISSDYIESVDTAFKKGDIVRAEVIQVEPSIQLNSQSKDLGVVKGFCTNCRKDLDLKRGKLYCENCDHYEKRKISSAYGKIKLKER
ncbi:MAG: exosome complex RNA-binding protein Csl4 [Candidatus Saliniplasma sp.]